LAAILIVSGVINSTKKDTDNTKSGLDGGLLVPPRKKLGKVLEQATTKSSYVIEMQNIRLKTSYALRIVGCRIVGCQTSYTLEQALEELLPPKGTVAPHIPGWNQLHRTRSMLFHMMR